MIGDSVAIELPAEVSELDAKRAQGACEAALGDEQCFIGPPPEQAKTPWMAFVEPREQGVWVVRLVRRDTRPLDAQAGAPGEAERRLNFTADDPEAYRWQAAGIVVASLVLAAPAPEEEATSAPPVTLEPGAPLSFLRGLHLDLAGEVSSGLTPTSPSFGGVLRAVFDFPAALGAALDVRAANSQSNLTLPDASAAAVSATGLAVGLGVVGRLEDEKNIFRGEAYAQVVGRALWLRAEDTLGAETSVVDSWGGRLGLLASVQVAPRLSVFAGGDLGLQAPTVDLLVGNQQVASLGPVYWGAQLGLRLHLSP